MRDVVSRYVRNTEAVRDILHDGFLIAFASLSSLKDASKAQPWLTAIMKNLAMRYLKESLSHDYVPVTEEMEEYTAQDTDGDTDNLSWDDISRILDKLPEGYGRIFRLAVLDGISHKEIGAMLGIAPHSSSSQLVRAKAMLRRLIHQYRIEMRLLSIVAAALAVWLLMPEHEVAEPSSPEVSSTDGSRHKVLPDTAATRGRNDSTAVRPRALDKILRESEEPEKALISEIIVPVDSVVPVSTDSVTENTDLIPVFRLIDAGNMIALQKKPVLRRSHSSGWSLSLAYSGFAGHFSAIRNRDLLSDWTASPGEPPGTMGKEETHHKMPVVIGVSLSKSLSSRWSVETGVRYSFLESETRKEGTMLTKRVNRQIHYIGVPLKFSYRFCTFSGFSLYGHTGGALDIPVRGRQSTWRIASHELKRESIDAPLQWSIEGGAGIQYHFTPSFSVFAEPSLRYYFNPGGKIETIRQEKPVEIVVPIGLRLTW